MSSEVAVVKTSPVDEERTCRAMSFLWVRRRRIGYKATKRVEKTPATIDSQITRSLLRMLAMRRLNVRTNALLSVGMEWFVRPTNAVRMSVTGTVGMRDSVYSGS